MASRHMVGIHAVRVGIHRRFMTNGQSHSRNLVDILMPWPPKADGGKIVYGPNLDDGFAEDVTMYAGTYQNITDGTYLFDLPNGVTAKGVKQYGESGTVTVTGLYISSRTGSSGPAEIRGAGVDNPPGVRWKLEHAYKRLGD